MKRGSRGVSMSFNGFLKLTLPLCVSSVSQMAPGDSYAEQIKITGSLTISGQHTERMAFTCESSGSTWKINTWKTSFTNAAIKASSRFHEVSCDGTNTYWLSVDSTNAFVKTLSGNPSARIAQQVGMVTKGVLPVLAANLSQAPTHVAPIWFAFCSSGYLDHRKGDRMEPVWIVHPSMAEDPEVFPKVQIQRSTKAPYLPLKAKFFSTGLTKTGRSDNETRTVRRKPPFDDGFKVAEFTATGVTNVVGQTFPIKASLTTFGPLPQAKTKDDLLPLMTWEIHTTAFDVVSHENENSAHPARPHLVSELMYVASDARLSQNKNVRSDYTSTNGWIAENDPRFGELRQETLRMKSGLQEPGRPLKIVFLLLFFALSGLFILILARVRKT